MAHTFSEADRDVACLCAADNAEIEVMGMGTFLGNFKGKMAVRTGQEKGENGLTSLGLTIMEHETNGVAGGIGGIHVRHDYDRPAPPSRIQELEPGTGFPASQEMYVNIKVTIDALPGIVLRNVATGVLRCSSQQSFPPKDARYELQEPMDLEDEANPGQVVARMVAYTAVINPSPVEV